MKKDLGPYNVLYPMPVTLVGTNINGKPNFLTIAPVGILNVGKPQCISAGLSKSHATNAGIRENQSFSVCMPNEDLVVETDYVGITSAAKADKSRVFEVFYGELKNAPMAKECPLCMECCLHEVLDFKTHDIFIGEIVASYAEEDILTDGAVDLAKLRPMVFDMHTRRYWKVGEPIAQAWSVGKQYKR